MDEQRLYALLDQASEWLAQGDLVCAERLIAKASKIAPEDPELLSLKASVASETGRREDAIALWERASAAAPDWVDPILSAADEELEAFGDAQSCLRRVEPLIDHESAEVRGEVQLLRARAFVELEDERGALAALETLAATPFEGGELALDAGDIAITLGRPELAERWLRGALARDPEDLDVLHALGLALREKGALDEMAACWLRVRAADLEHPRPRWHLRDEEIEACMVKALQELPAEVHAHLRNVPLFVEDAPSEALIREGVDPRLLGLFTGTPLPDKTIGSSPSAPDAAYVFARNLENVCESRAAMLEEIRVTVLHETAHFFGLDDEQLAELGLD